MRAGERGIKQAPDGQMRDEDATEVAERPTKQLAALGLVDAWNETSADFSAVSSLGRGKLHLGAVLHWTSLELAPESGSKDGMHEDEDVEKPKIFYADHSFIILVRDNSTGALLMVGALDHTDGPAIHDEL
ncbi:serpin H1-like protein [Labeo rohita]|uniref:Serpin H1-like protein n=1 Tax=Labeo rohita TaxID=84645 RepID=A0A498MMJ6_LABRO|nr:serpin H1-like protein [Labeo rohita]